MTIYYNKTHGISFWDITEENGLTYPYPNDSWEDFFLVPHPRPDIVDGTPNFFVFGIPGTSKRVDITDTMPGHLTFGKRQGIWEFYVDHDKWSDWIESFNALVGYFHGRRMMVCLNDDPTKYYTGVVTVTGFDPGKDYSKVTLSYDLDHGYWDFSDENVPVPPSDRFPDWPEIFMRVRFLGRNGNVIDSQYLMCGSYPTVPPDPVEDGYTFTGWSPSIHRVTGNCDYRAQFSQNESHNPTPEQQYRYRFLVPDSDSIEELKQNYQFQNIQYEVLEEGELKRSETPRVPAYTRIPKIENFKFNKWDPDVKPLKSNTDYYARYTLKETVPDRIWVAIHPTKMIYNPGESIDLSGIKVEALNEDGTLWTSSRYPDGVIPLSELSFTPTTAQGDILFVNDAGTIEASYFSTDSSGRFEYGYVWGLNNSGFLATVYDGAVYFAGSDGQNHGHHSVVISAYGGSGADFTYYFDDTSFPDPNAYFARSSVDPETVGNVTDLTPILDITIQWHRPTDNEILEASFRIGVNPGVSG